MHRMEHRTEVIADLNVTGMSTALCRCGWMSGDSTQLVAEQEARDHEAEPESPQLEPWTPDKHPVPGFRMR